MVYIFFFGFILLFFGGYILFGAFVGWGVVTAIALLLQKILSPFCSLLSRRGKLIQKSNEGPRVRLDDAIGVMSLISHRYSDLLFLKDLAFLEVQLFGKNSSEVIQWFRLAEGDPRPEVCGAFAGKIILFLARVRHHSISHGDWSEQQEDIWKKGVPSELHDLSEARSA